MFFIIFFLLFLSMSNLIRLHIPSIYSAVFLYLFLYAIAFIQQHNNICKPFVSDRQKFKLNILSYRFLICLSATMAVKGNFIFQSYRIKFHTFSQKLINKTLILYYFNQIATAKIKRVAGKAKSAKFIKQYERGLWQSQNVLEKHYFFFRSQKKTDLQTEIRIERSVS